MKVGDDVVVGLEYVITDREGREIDRTPSGQPWFYLHGAKACPPGLERALSGKEPGARLEVELPPEETYGRRNEDAVFRLDRAVLPSDQEPKVGMVVSMMSKKGETELRVVDVTSEAIVVDANHPLADQTLRFSVHVVDVRRATAEEILSGEAEA
ncbi:MAG: peptidylprolyl isomerase [Myxococcota bacterium]